MQKKIAFREYDSHRDFMVSEDPWMIGTNTVGRQITDSELNREIKLCADNVFTELGPELSSPTSNDHIQYLPNPVSWKIPQMSMGDLASEEERARKPGKCEFSGLKKNVTSSSGSSSSKDQDAHVEFLDDAPCSITPTPHKSQLKDKDEISSEDEAREKRHSVQSPKGRSGGSEGSTSEGLPSELSEEFDLGEYPSEVQPRRGSVFKNRRADDNVCSGSEGARSRKVHDDLTSLHDDLTSLARTLSKLREIRGHQVEYLQFLRVGNQA